MVPQKILTENINSELSRNLSIIFIVILDQKLRPIQHSWFFDICPFYKNITFSLNLWRILQSLQECKIALRPHNDTCDTAFESLDVIVLNMIIFGYHGGTQNTQNFIYVRHLKGGRLERGHFELCGIRQQVLTITIIIKKSALPSSFRKYLSPRS